MPAIFWAAAILWGSLVASPLVDRTGARPHHERRGKPAKVEYNTWTAFGNKNRDGSCPLTVFAMTTRNTIVDLQVDGRFYPHNWSWKFDGGNIPSSRSVDIEVVFLELGTGRVLARHRIHEVCWLEDPYGER